MSSRSKIIESAVLKAGRYLARDYGEVENLQVSKKGAGDFVTSADIKTERILLEELQKSFPDYNYVLEEAGQIKGSDNKYLFAIDPIDGTTNFMHGNPFFCISVALLEKQDSGSTIPVDAVIYAPAFNDLYKASKGEGAFVNNRRMSVSNRGAFEECIFASYVSRNDAKTRKSDISSLSDIRCHSRVMGAAALELAYVACGKIDAMWHNNLKIWDLAAGSLMVQESRGMISEINGGKNYLSSGSILASNSEVYEKLVEKLKEHY